jgi:ArsR family transcriptional regulator
LSFHLKVLKDAGLITDRRHGRWVYYTLDAAALDALGDFIAGLKPRRGGLRLSPRRCD